jgi:hypothetical protein
VIGRAPTFCDFEASCSAAAVVRLPVLNLNFSRLSDCWVLFQLLFEPQDSPLLLKKDEDEYCSDHTPAAVQAGCDGIEAATTCDPPAPPPSTGSLVPSEQDYV